MTHHADRFARRSCPALNSIEAIRSFGVGTSGPLFNTEVRMNQSRKKLLYQRMLAAGGAVETQAEWRALGQSVGYTARSDLAGFFGGRVPSVVREGDRRVLTQAGRQRALALI
jgi:hypothetical protein